MFLWREIIVLASFILCVRCQTPNPKPNIVFIISDDQGFHDVGYHGAEIKTPNMDELALSGVRLENYYVQPLCTPSRMALMSGRYQSNLGVQDILLREEGGLPLDITTFPEVLQKSGYATHAIGKWHLGYSHKEYTPTYRGFDTFYGFYSAGVSYFNHCWGPDNVIICCHDLHFNIGTNMNIVHSEEYITNLFGDRAVNVIRNHNREQPLYLYTAFSAPHSPLQAPQYYLDMYDFIQDDDRRTYAAMVTAMDDAIGNITAALDESGMWENTIIIFTGDNGGVNTVGGYNNPLRGEKAGLYEGGIRTLGFVSSPLLGKPETISTGLLHISDWYPTLVKLAGGDTAGIELDGFDVWHHISEGSQSPRTELVHNINNDGRLVGENLHPDIFDVRVPAAIRVGDYKLITGAAGGRNNWNEPPGYKNKPHHSKRGKRQGNRQNVELYNIATDPEERVELSGSAPELVIGLLRRLAFYNQTAVPALQFPEADVRCAETGWENVPWL